MTKLVDAKKRTEIWPIVSLFRGVFTINEVQFNMNQFNMNQFNMNQTICHLLVEIKNRLVSFKNIDKFD